MNLKFVTGDATSPIGEGIKIICHVCNDIGGWGSGFVLAISKKWSEPEKQYRVWFSNKMGVETDTVKYEKVSGFNSFSNERNFHLGNVQFVKVADDIWVANMIAQRSDKNHFVKDSMPPIRYQSVSECLERVKNFAIKNNATVHMPRIGCGLAGGKWSTIEEIVLEQLCTQKVITTVYDTGKNDFNK